MVNEFEDEFEVTMPAQWKALSHPLRLRMLDLLAERALTNEELADALGEQSGKLYFHTRRLREAGLILPAGTRRKGPLTEKLYRAVARRFIAARPVKGGVSPPLDQVLSSALDLYRGNWRETDGLPAQTEFGFHLILTLTREQEQQLLARVRALLEDFQAEGTDAPDARPVSLAVLMHSFTTQGKKGKKEKTDAAEIDSGTDCAGPGGRAGADGPIAAG